ncbi:MAG: T9SS type A sorting domain-containing protein [Flavobacteriaceae bacterium]|nr:T9SS type A sorting domain-containing protein [Flavobacteriaceae bacterium]
MTNKYSLLFFAKRITNIALLLLLLICNGIAQPCQPAYTTGTTVGDFISLVRLDSINNKTAGASSPYFTYFNSLSTSVSTGKSYWVKIAPGSNVIASNNIAVWIDYNQNDTFEASEKLGQKNGLDSFEVDSIYFTVPNNADSGKTRMRVRNVWNAGNASISPCASATYGETEDYVVYINYIACTSPPTAGTIASATTTLCDGDGFTLYLTGNTSGGGQTVQWQNSTDTVNWTNINGATNSSYSSTQSTTSNYYRCYMVCSGNADTTAWILLSTKAANQCYCLPTHPACTSTDIITNLNILGTCLNQTLTACNNTSTNYYYDFTSGIVPILTPGNTYDLGVTTTTNNIISVWIDYDQDGLLEASEWNQVATTTTANKETVKTITIPAGAKVGTTRMRIRSRLTANANGSGDACLNMGSGVMHDYTVDIRQPLTKDVAVGSLVSPSIFAPCFSATEPVEFQIVNAGKDTIDMSLDSVHLQVTMTESANTTTIDTVITSGKIAPGDIYNVLFSRTLDMSTGSTIYDFSLKAELALAVDSQFCNDTLADMRASVAPIAQVYLEDFDVAGSIPASFTSNGYKYSSATGAGGGGSLRASMVSGVTDVLFYTPLIGSLTNISTFKFSYKSSGQLANSDSVCVFISADCGKNFDRLFTIKTSNSIGNNYKTIQLNLDQYSGSNVVLAVFNFYNSGNTYSVDFDDIALGERPVIDLGPDTSICGSITIDANPNSQNWDFIWNNNSTNTIRIFAATGNYWMKATDVTSGIVGIDTVRIVVYNKPTVNLGSNVYTCPGGTSSALDAGSWPSNYTILWSTGDTSRIITPSASGTYSVIVTTPGTCFGTDTIDVAYANRPIGVTMLQGSPFNGKFNSGSPDDICVGNTITYELTPPSGYANSDFGKKWKVVGNGPILLTSNGTIPSIGTVAAIAANSSSNAQMTFKPTAAESDSTYIIYFTVKDSVTGCDTVVMRTVKVNALPVVNLHDQTACPNILVTFDAGSFTTYNWNTGATSQTISVSTPGKYIVEVTDGNGCKNTDSAQRSNYTSPIVNLGVDKKLCPGQVLILNAGTFNGYNWSTSETTQTISVTAGGDYAVEITDANGCKDIDSINVNMLPAPLSTFTFTTSGLNATFTPDDQNHQTYHWYFGDAGQSFVKIPNHAYAISGLYTVSLVATGVNGCNDSVAQSLPLNTGLANIEGLNNVSVFPNPYQEQTTLKLELSKTANVTVLLFDQLGRMVATVADRKMDTGINLVMIDTRKYQAAQGIYHLQITMNGQATNLRLVDVGGQK